jgi:hypothetical protein
MHTQIVRLIKMLLNYFVMCYATEDAVRIVDWFYYVLYIQRLRSRKPKLTAVGIRWADHATPSIR